jgi:uncharacterized repeat protein (TIGR03803 family)
MRRFCNIASGSFLAVLATFVLPENAEAEKVLYSFAGGEDGSEPNSRLVMDNDGNFYGTTFAGGASDAGTVFKLTPHGKKTLVYSFTGGDDGGEPIGDLIIGFDGNLYGTTIAGGASGTGTVFQLTPKGKETVLYSFTGGSDGRNPRGGVIMDGDGNLYGTTFAGGTGSVGVVFKLKPNGKEKVLYSFTSGSDGGNPECGLVMDSDGNLYGTAVNGGDLNQGVVFKVKPNGTEKVLHSFAGSSVGDGNLPISSLIMGADGNLYGTTPTGGSGTNAGTVFKLTLKGKEDVLHSFAGADDGASPIGSLVMDATGNLYGATSAGGLGDASVGTVFKLTPKGKEKVLHSFDAAIDVNDGFQPSSGLIMDASGNLYGVTAQGGSSGDGTVFKDQGQSPIKASLPESLHQQIAGSFYQTDLPACLTRQM